MQKYTKESIKQSIDLFIEKFKREPSSHDFNHKNNLPNKKTIERRFGGLVNFRKEFGLYIDHRKGQKRKETALEINKREKEWSSIVYKKLLTFFQEPFVHRESSIFDDRRNRTDFKVYGKKTFIVDIFYPKDRYSLLGCVSAKSKKYPPTLRDYMDKKFDRVIFLNLNDNIENNIPLSKDFFLMSQQEFWDYCQTML